MSEFQNWKNISDARRLAVSFLDNVQAVHGVAVTDRAIEVVELVVSELVTNAAKYAPGPSRMILEVTGGRVEVSVWDSNPTPPMILPPNPFRIGRHGLEIVTAAAESVRIRQEREGKRITAAVALSGRS